MIQYCLSDLAEVLGAEHGGDDVHFVGCSHDTRALKPGSLYIALRGERFDGHEFIPQACESGAVAVLTETPTERLPYLQVKDTKAAMGQLAAHWRSQFDIPLVAVTGSNGKTTVKEMLRAIFSELGPTLATRGNLNNEIGLPLTLFELDDSYTYAVAEMGANHPGEICYLTQIGRPQVATITLCAPAHLEGFGSIEGVAKAKGEIFEGLPDDGIAVINADDDYADFWRTLKAGRACLTFGLEKAADVTAKDIKLNNLQSDFTLHTPNGRADISLPLPGRHNIMNALSAAACALASKATIESIVAGLSKMKAVNGRLQTRVGPRHTIILDDTYNANPHSLDAALDVLANCASPRWLVLGDMLELGEGAESFHAKAGMHAKCKQVEKLFAMGELSRLATDSFGSGSAHFAQQADLIETLKREIPEGATVLVKGSRGSKMENVVTALAEEK